MMVLDASSSTKFRRGTHASNADGADDDVAIAADATVDDHGRRRYL
jgi:hypothetical protein